MRWLAAVAAATIWASGVEAADDPGSRIVVSGAATVSTPPDLATIEFRVVGEGATSDAAVAAMAARQRSIAAVVAVAERPRASDVSVVQVRGAGCRRDDDDAAPRLSTGACAVVGYIATIGLTLRTGATQDAGTLVGLLGRAGAQNPRVEGFALADPRDAERRAMAAALRDARGRAEAIAAATGVGIGRVLLVATDPRDDIARDIVVTGSRLPPPTVVPPPHAVDQIPRPIETTARVTVTYAIAP